MPEIKNIKKLTDSRYLNMYELDARNRVGGAVDYFVASRAKSAEELELVTKVCHPDGVGIFSLYGEAKDRVVLIRQYRYTLDDYIYELPAGLIDEGEDPKTASVREMKEETGLDFHPIQADPMFERPYYTTIGMTDESLVMSYGYSDGEVSRKYLEDDEELDVVIADRTEVLRILKEERVALICAFMLMHFLSESEPFGFLKQV
ncbi:MAG: NUDIX hydrolase [Eubacteriales bacterium]|nr:NUDIX hydrolase [Eubacteriales bacterium]